MGFFSTWSERLDLAVRMVVPYALIGVSLAVNTLNFPIDGGYIFNAPLVIMSIYYWCIYRPSMMPSWLVFGAGIFIDVISGVPLGLNGLIFVLAQWVITDQRRYLTGQSFAMIWVGFIFVVFLTATLEVLLFRVMQGVWPNFMDQVISGMGASCLFPIFYWFLHMSHKILPVPTEPRSAYKLKPQTRVGTK